MAKRYFENIPDFVVINVQSMRTIRKNLCWEQADVAKHIGIHRKTLYEYESGRHIPAKNNYNKLARYFDWEVWE